VIACLHENVVSRSNFPASVPCPAQDWSAIMPAVAAVGRRETPSTVVGTPILCRCPDPAACWWPDCRSHPVRCRSGCDRSTMRTRTRRVFPPRTAAYWGAGGERQSGRTQWDRLQFRSRDRRRRNAAAPALTLRVRSAQGGSASWCDRRRRGRGRPHRRGQPIQPLLPNCRSDRLAWGRHRLAWGR
jgi:hypothetical protein